MQDSQDSPRIMYFLHALRIFQAEFSAHLKAWPEISLIVEVSCNNTKHSDHITTIVVKEVIRSGPSAVSTYEAIADILVRPQQFSRYPFLMMETVARPILPSQTWVQFVRHRIASFIESVSVLYQCLEVTICDDICVSSIVTNKY